MYLWDQNDPHTTLTQPYLPNDIPVLYTTEEEESLNSYCSLICV